LIAAVKPKSMKTDSEPETDKRSAGVSPAVSFDEEGKSQRKASRPATLTATFLGIGHMRPGPGTWASATTILLWWLLTIAVIPQWQTAFDIFLILLVIAVGIPAATRVAQANNLKDPSFVVIDEVAGQLISLIAVPITWKSLLAGFILFRGFDIIKPFPVRRLERLPGGTGIVLDDVGAGLYALIVMHALLHTGLLQR
jgi:phosphatidylglycerophosphatase A